MNTNKTTWMHTAVMAACLALTACGGGSDDQSAAGLAQVNAAREQALKGGGGGTASPSPGVSVLPTTAPAPDILVRESFGLAGAGGLSTVRPAGGKGQLKEVGRNLNGFWVEYPGSKGSSWIAPEGASTWGWCYSGVNPNELPSPLQPTDRWGVACSQMQVDNLADVPTALLPFRQPDVAYTVSADGQPPNIPGTYVAIGLTATAATLNNFATAGQVWLSLHNEQGIQFGGPLVYELRLNGKTGPLLATGVVEDIVFNRLAIRHDPTGGLVSASVNGIDLGSYPLQITPAFAGFEGVGTVDNFVIRTLP